MPTKDMYFRQYSKDCEKYGVDSPAVMGWGDIPRDQVVEYQVLDMSGLVIIRADETVLEFGCGNLLTYDALLQQGMNPSNYLGVEIVPEFIEYARSRGVKTVPKLPARHFSWVVGNGVLVGIKTSKGQVELIRSLLKLTERKLYLSTRCAKNGPFRAPNMTNILKAVEGYSSECRYSHSYFRMVISRMQSGV